MDIDITKRGNNLVVSLSGELDHHSSDYFRDSIDKELNKGIFNNLLLELSQLTFMDSSGLGVILGRYKQISEQGGQVVACGLTPQVKKLVDMSGLTKVIYIYQDVNEAEQSLEKGRVT